MHGVHGVGSSNLPVPTIRIKDLRRKLYETRYRILDIGLVSVPGFSVYATYDQASFAWKVSMSHRNPFDVISSTVDLDDPAEHVDAQRFMVRALARVIECLPLTAQSSVLAAKRHLEGAATDSDALTAKVMLWEAIRGRDMSDDPDVLRIRATICALHGMDAEAPYDKLSYFLTFWERSGLSMVELAGAMFDTYGVVYHDA